MTSKLQDLFFVVLVSLIWLGLSWSWARVVRRGRPMTPGQREMFWYAFGFIVGTCCIMMFGSWFAWPRPLWFVLSAAWGVTLTLVAWLRHRHRSARPQGRSIPSQRAHP